MSPRSVRISRQQYQQLVDYINRSFERDTSGQDIPLALQVISVDVNFQVAALLYVLPGAWLGAMVSLWRQASDLAVDKPEGKGLTLSHKDH